MERQCPDHSITNYVAVPSVDHGCGEGRETWRQNLHGKNGGAGDGLLCRLPRHGEQYVCALGTGREGEIVVLKAIARSSQDRKPKQTETKYEHRNNDR